MRKNEKGFGIVEGLLIVAVIGLLGVVGWLFYDKQKSKTAEYKTTKTTKKETKPQPKPDPNEGYLVVTQWGLRFKVPNDLTNVKYVIKGDEVNFSAEPVGSDVQLRRDDYGMSILVRSTDSTKLFMGEKTVQGKKIGNYYYYTYWSFNNLASGRAYLGVYLDDACTKEFNGSGDLSSRCQNLLQAEDKASKLLDEMLSSIEPAQ